MAATKQPNEEARHKPADPTHERTAEQTTQSASGLSGGDAERGHSEEEDLIARTPSERHTTPRRYEENEDPTMPSDDSALNTKI